jgi:UDP-N-acetylmuramoylalanine--D-glutamate ligase
VGDENCRKVAKTFPGVPHRLEIVRKFRGVTYCNDSIASSPPRTIAGLRSFDRKVILIAGGYDNADPLRQLGDVICKRVKACF